jgi:uncharacterized membrane protein
MRVRFPSPARHEVGSVVSKTRVVTNTQLFLVLSVFLASAVEMVEATTIVLAVGTTRGWRGAFMGVGAGLATLAAIVGALGPAVAQIPLSDLRTVVGGLLLVFGLTWLRKAILRAAGLKDLHDEDAIFAEEREAARLVAISAGAFDSYGFALSFKGVLLEGLEVAFIVLTFGGNAKDIPLAAVGAALAAVVVVALAVAVRAPLARVPENTMKYAVGLMLVTFGTFWGSEGVGVHWPGSDGALPVLLVCYLAASVAIVATLKRRQTQSTARAPSVIEA